MIERSLVVLKPDTIERKLVGECIKTFEQAGFNIIAIKMMSASKELLTKHYQKDDEWYAKVGGFQIKDHEKIGLNVKKELGTDNPIELGKIVVRQLIEYVSTGKVIAMVLEGNRAPEKIRKIVGDTYPINADPGSIRGRFCTDSTDITAYEKRAVRNLIHASGSSEEAAFEISLWFPEIK